MTRAAVAAVLALLVLAAPAHALNPAPTVVTFATASDANQFPCDGSTSPSGSIVKTGGWDGKEFFRATCTSFSAVRIRFPVPQHIFEIFVRVPRPATVDVQACDPQQCDGGTIDEVSAPLAANVWTPLRVEDPAGATIDNATVSVSVQLPFDIDDAAFSPVAQPDTAVVSGTDTVAAGGTASFNLASSSPGATFQCALDGGAFAACANPFSAPGLPAGPHTLQARAIDVWGRLDDTPATFPFTVAAPPPPPPADRDHDGVLDADDNCPDVANSDQADADADGVGNACDTLPPGNVPPVAGVSAVAKVLSGEVFVKLPVKVPLGFRGLRAPFQETGFVSLKGVASLPVGSTVDSRAGELQLASAANGYAPASRRAHVQNARLKAGIFAIRQAKLRKKAKKKTPIPTTVALVSGAGTEAQCAPRAAKGIVRTLTMTAKGVYRAVAGASTAMVSKGATFVTTDRCDGTLTQVGQGKVTLDIKARKADVTVRAGRAFFVKARLFAAKKGIKSR